MKEGRKRERERERGRGFVSFITASFPPVCLPPYKRLQSGTEKIKCGPTKKKEKDTTNTPTGDAKLHTGDCDDTRRDKEDVFVINARWCRDKHRRGSDREMLKRGFFSLRLCYL